MVVDQRAVCMGYKLVWAQGTIIRWGVHWRHLENTIERYGVAAATSAVATATRHVFKLLRAI